MYVIYKYYLMKEIKSLEGHKDGSPLGLSIYKNYQGFTVHNFCLNEDGPDWDWACFLRFFDCDMLLTEKNL